MSYQKSLIKCLTKVDVMVYNIRVKFFDTYSNSSDGNVKSAQYLGIPHISITQVWWQMSSEFHSLAPHSRGLPKLGIGEGNV